MAAPGKTGPDINRHPAPVKPLTLGGRDVGQGTVDQRDQLCRLARCRKADRGHHVNPPLAQRVPCLRKAAQQHRLEPQPHRLGDVGQDLDLGARALAVGGYHFVGPVVGQAQANPDHRQRGDKSPLTRGQHVGRRHDQPRCRRLAKAVVQAGGSGGRCGGGCSRRGGCSRLRSADINHPRGHSGRAQHGRCGHGKCQAAPQARQVGLKATARAADWPAQRPSARPSCQTAGRGAPRRCAR